MITVVSEDHSFYINISLKQIDLILLLAFLKQSRPRSIHSGGTAINKKKKSHEKIREENFFELLRIIQCSLNTRYSFPISCFFPFLSISSKSLSFCLCLLIVQPIYQHRCYLFSELSSLIFSLSTYLYLEISKLARSDLSYSHERLVLLIE